MIYCDENTCMISSNDCYILNKFFALFCFDQITRQSETEIFLANFNDELVKSVIRCFCSKSIHAGLCLSTTNTVTSPQVGRVPLLTLPIFPACVYAYVASHRPPTKCLVMTAYIND